MNVVGRFSARRPPVGPRGLGVAFLWGFAEATFFFIVPDVLLTRFALQDLRRALLGCLWATLGAVVGGCILWFLARENPGLVLRWIERLPGIPLEVVLLTGNALHDQGLVAMFSGALSGHPFKLFAAHAGAQGFGLAGFIAVSALSRLARFAGTSLIAWLISRALGSAAPLRLLLHATFWLVFYLIYFWRMR